MVKVKLCGLKRLCDIEWTNKVMPDYAGFVFAGQKRRVTDELAASLRHHLRPEIQAVGVFQNEDIHHIADLVRKGTIQLVQLHGCEDEDYIRELRNIISVPVIQALSLDREDQLEAVRCSSADYILLDHGTGGTGQVALVPRAPSLFPGRRASSGKCGTGTGISSVCCRCEQRNRDGWSQRL